MRIVILGCGPAGLLAAHAASFTDAKVFILSRKARSELFGCQYLHGPIPGLDLRTTTIDYQLRGEVHRYQEKVYGQGPVPGGVSPGQLTGSHPAWDIRQAYDLLWDRFENNILEQEVVPSDVEGIKEYFQPDLLVNSIPLAALCLDMESHAFTSQQCWAMGDAPERGQEVPVPCPDDTVICDGTRDVGYYRVSNVFGYKTVEYPGLRPKPPLAGLVPFHKPLATTCTCHPGMLRVGRYGTWTKGVLSHTAFNEVVKAMAHMVAVTS